jgi:hypothetical protein
MTDGRHRQQRRTDVKLKLITAAVLATVVATTLIAAPASAGPLGNAFQRQKAAIGNGLANNSLTLNEAGRLIKQTKRIKKEYQFLNAGGLNSLERMYLGARLVGNWASIYYHKHN